MKILHVVHAYSPALGGTEFLVQQVSEYLSNAAKESVSVYTTFAYNTALFTDPKAASLQKDNEEEIINNVKVRRFPVKNRWGKYLYYLQYICFRLRLWGNGRLRMLYYGPISPALKKGIKEADHDIIVAAPFPLNHTNYVFKNRHKKPVVLIGCMHTTDRHGFANPRLRKNIRRADGYVALSTHEKDYLVQEWGIDEKKIRVIGVGLKTECPPVKQEIRERLGINKGAPVIAFVGQHGLHKGLETLILSMKTIWQSYPAARLIIAGGTSPFTDSMKQLAAFIDGEERIFFLDNIDEELKNDILCGCDIFATPSGFESFGITIIEAWKRKRPVVACRIPATKSLICEYENGLLVDYKHAPELAQALQELLADPELRCKIGEGGYEKFVSTYSWEVVGKKYHDFYREVAGESKPEENNG
ncbi:MAG: glycosyltransferase family 4 protein [bacterium]|nr:glycosyltransferase family 4 protein [bacterium]